MTTGAIDAEAFLAAHGEIVATFAKIYDILPELRAAIEEPEFCKHIEAVVLTIPDAVTAMHRRGGKLRAAVVS